MRRWIVVLLLLLAVPVFAQQLVRRTHQLASGGATDTTAVGMADSSSVIGTSQYKQMYLYIKPDQACRIAIEVRRHGLLDTTSVSLSDSVNMAAFVWRAVFDSTGVTADGTVKIKNTAISTSVVPGSHELVIEFPPAAASKWGGPRGIWIPIINNIGFPYSAKYTSVRWRVLQAAGVVTFRVVLEGTN